MPSNCFQRGSGSRLLDACLTAHALFGCAATGDSPDSAGAPTQIPGSSGASPPNVIDRSGGPSAAYLDGEPIRRDELATLTLEIAGVQALMETILDRRLAQAAANRGLSIGPSDIEREQSLLKSTLSADPDDAVRLLEEIRFRQGLGPQRFEKLLRRNATLRALVRDEVQVTDDMLRQTFEMMHGERRQGRIIVVPTLAAAEGVLARLAAGEAFADLAAEVSTDVSASRGGLLAPISPADPSFPRAIREALVNLPPQAVSAPILINDGLAIVTLERVVPADQVAMESVRDEIAQTARANLERIRMEELATQLLAGAAPTINDETLRAAWERARRL